MRPKEGSREEMCREHTLSLPRGTRWHMVVPPCWDKIDKECWDKIDKECWDKIDKECWDKIDKEVPSDDTG